MCHKRTMQSLCFSTFVTVVEVLRDNRMKLSLLKGHKEGGTALVQLFSLAIAMW